MNRWLAAGLWLLAFCAMSCASVGGSAGVAVLWSLPPALVGTFAIAGWPGRPFPRVVAALAIVWQLALVGAYWPFALHDAGSGAATPLRWPLQSLIIAGILALLVFAFVALFLLPGIGLCRRIGRAAALAWSARSDHAQAVGNAFQPDLGLLRAWEDYQAQWYLPQDGHEQAGSRSSAADWFEVHHIAQARLRIEFFRNLPGIFTGLGIIGTFTGLILGLRSFHISQDPGVIQKSLEALLSGVWEAFMISALAIALAISLTVVEKLLMTALARRVERLVLGLDRAHPVRSGLDAGQLLQLIERLGTGIAQRDTDRQHAPADTMSPSPAAVRPSPIAPEHPAAAAAAPTEELHARHELAWTDVAAATRASAMAVSEAAQRLPEAMARQLESAMQAQLGALQGMRVLSSRLEGVASGIEVSGRKTLEGVAARLMQAEMNMASRHHAMVEHLGEVVQRMEALCGLLQQDRKDLSPPGLGMSQYAEHAGAGWPGLGDPASMRPQSARQHAYGARDGTAYAAEGTLQDGHDYVYPVEDDPWAPRGGGDVGFGS